MDTITKDRLRAEWSDWLSEKHVNLLTEYPGATRELLGGNIDVTRIRTTAYVHEGVGYKLFRRSDPVMRHIGMAWRFRFNADIQRREDFHQAVKLVEATPAGLETLFPIHRAASINTDNPMARALGAEFCEEYLGPPPPGCSYVEVDYTLRRMTPAYLRAQSDAYVFGPMRVRALVDGMRNAGIVDNIDIVNALGISHKLLLEWLSSGTEFVRDEYVTMDRVNQKIPQTRYGKRIQPILDLAGYEKFSPPAGYWAVSDGNIQ